MRFGVATRIISEIQNWRIANSEFSIGGNLTRMARSDLFDYIDAPVGGMLLPPT